MYWLARPPYWRWFAAVLIITIASYMDLSGPATESYPFVAAAADIGEQIVVEWKQVPQGVFRSYGDLSGVARTALAAGTPIVDGLLAPAGGPPHDWWALPADLPSQAVVGSNVLIAIRDPDEEVVGIVVAAAQPASFGGTAPGLLAIPPQHAADVAAALAESRATVLISP